MPKPPVRSELFVVDILEHSVLDDLVLARVDWALDPSWLHDEALETRRSILSDDRCKLPETARNRIKWVISCSR